MAVTVAEKILKLVNSSGHSLRVGYDGSNYASFQTDASGDLTVGVTGSSVTISPALTVSGAVTLSSTLSSTGAATLDTGANGSSFGGDLTVSGGLTVSGAGPHAIGGATFANVAFALRGPFAGDGSGTAYGIYVSHNVSGASGDTSLRGTVLTSNLTTQGASEALTSAAQLWLDEPNITVGAGDTIANASTLYIGDAPTEASNNYALWVDAGTSRFDGPLDLTDISAGSPNLKITATSDTPTSSPETDAEAGWMEITVGGSTRYIPFYT